MKKLIVAAGMIVTLVIPVYAGQGEWKLQQGNRFYHQDKFQEATQLYSDAVELDPNRSLYRFNLGDGFYKSGNYPAAAKSFEQAMATADKKLEEKAAYNLGNAEFKWGVSQENADINKAIELVEHSIRHYKRSVELYAYDTDAKVNQAVAEEKLKELQERKKKESQQQKREQNKQEEQNKQQNQQGQQNQQEQESQHGQSQQSKDQKTSSGSEQEEQGKQNNSRDGKSQQDKSKEQKEQQSGSDFKKQEDSSEQRKQGEIFGERPEHMSDEEARMLLDGYRQEERMFGTIDDTHKSQSDKVAKDW